MGVFRCCGGVEDSRQAPFFPEARNRSRRGGGRVFATLQNFHVGSGKAQVVPQSTGKARQGEARQGKAGTAVNMMRNADYGCSDKSITVPPYDRCSKFYSLFLMTGQSKVKRMAMGTRRLGIIIMIVIIIIIMLRLLIPYCGYSGFLGPKSECACIGCMQAA